MGGVVSNPVDESTKHEIEELIKAILKTFTTEYTKWYAIYLVKKLMRDAAKDAFPEEWKLMKRPESKEDIKCGYLTKEGAIRKNWKKRFFVVKYDYSIQYFESEEEYKKEKPKAKGHIGLAGYHVVEDPNDGVLKRTMELAQKMGIDTSQVPKPKEYPKYCFEVHHSRRRGYFIQAANEEDFKSWVDVFKTACRNAYGLSDREYVHEHAFHAAVRRTRWELGHWGYWSYGGSEEQILSDLISDQIDYAVMGKIYGKISGAWQVRQMVRNQILKTLDTIISAGVSPAWKVMAAAVKEIRTKIEPKVKELVDPIGRAKETVMEKMKDAVMSLINPLLQEHVTPHLGKIMTIIRSPMTEAYSDCFQLFDARISKFEPQGDQAAVKKQFKDLDSYSRSWDLYPALDKTNVMYDPLWALNTIFSDIYPWGLIWAAHDELRHRMDNAIYTFEERLLKEMETAGSGADLCALRDKVKAQVIEDYKFDGRKGTTLYYCHIMKKIVSPPFDKVVIPACKMALEPIASVVPDPVKDFLDIQDTFEELVEKIIDASVKTCVEA
jgi:hypothetical protein